MKKTTTLILLLFIFLSSFSFHSCAISGLPQEPLMFREHYIDGLIIGSITFPYERARFNNYQFQLYSMDNNLNTRHFNIAPQKLVKMKHNGELDDGLTYLFAIRVPVGSYEFNRITFAAVNGYSQSSASIDISYPFISNKGKITYLGNFFIDEYADLNEIFLQNNDEKIRDIKSFKEIYPNIDWDNENMYSNNEILPQ